MALAGVRGAVKRKLHTYLSTSVAQPIRSQPTQMPTVQLDHKEQQLKLLLLDVAKTIDISGTATEPVVLRWAGGWVRDKLLGIPSHDIDVAINAMTGVAFAKHICDYCDTPEAREKHNIGMNDIGNLHNVAANPEKSKHLETAMVRMFGLDLDFVNLRKEVYTSDSRNPQMEFGTAEEDALRRDATINALFYNLNTDKVEDFTGGVPDMSAKIIRTPLEPLQTFTDDPLRVLRLVRFASRLGFTIDTQTKRFMSNEQVLNSLRVKISRERVGIELEKMLRGRNPVQALRFIQDLGLYTSIFTDPAQEPPNLEFLPSWPTAFECLNQLIHNETPGSISDLLIRTEDAMYVAWNLAALCPWMKVNNALDPKLKANALPPVAVVAREGFKAPNKLTDVIAASHRHLQEIIELKRAVNDGEKHIQERDRLGMAIRRWEAQGGSWKLQVLNALLFEGLSKFQRWETHGAPGEPFSEHAEKDDQDHDSFLRSWQQFLDHLVEMDVFDAPSIKRLLDGRALAKALGLKPGKWTGQALEVCMEWQLRNPGVTDPAGAIEEVRRRSDELGITLS